MKKADQISNVRKTLETTYAFDIPRYRGRNGIERMVARLKDFRRIAARYDKRAENIMAALCLAALICYWS